MYRVQKVKDFPIARDGVIYFICVALITGLIAVWCWIAAIIPGLAALFILFFFRNPVRVSSAGPDALLSPADATVMSITEIDEPDFIGGKAIKVSMFLSLFNVHINRSPMDGMVLYHHYRDGKMLPAFKSHASDINERNTIGIEGLSGYRILVHQITGFVARRIVWWVKPGDSLKRGERFGLIRFGSCTEIVVPVGTVILVKPGQKVRGGITIIGEKAK